MAPALLLVAAVLLTRQHGADAAQVALASGRDAARSISITWVTDEADDSCVATGYVDVVRTDDPSAASFRARATCDRYEFGSIFYGDYVSVPARSLHVL